MLIARRTTALFLLLGSFALSSQAAPVRWYLEDVTFDGGGRAEGSFVFDAEAGIFLSVDIRSSGLFGAVPVTFRGVPPDFPGDALQLVALPDPTVEDRTNELTLVLTFASPLTDEGGTRPFSPEPFTSIAGQCFNPDFEGRACQLFLNVQQVNGGRVTSVPNGDREPWCFVTGRGATRNCYEYVVTTEAMTWDEARRAAEGRTFLGARGHLATLVTPDESSWVSTVIPIDGPFPLIGARCLDGRCDGPTDYRWITGEEIEFAPWCPNEPNGDPDGVLNIFGDAHCWNDTIGDFDHFAYLVEYELSDLLPACFFTGPNATGSCYRTINHPRRTWTASALRAGDQLLAGTPGRLATITSADEQAFVAAETASPRSETRRGLEVLAPDDIVGSHYVGQATFGPSLAENGPVTGLLAAAADGVDEALDGCEELTPASATAVDGRIALVQRGGCLFVDKVLNAQAAGATAVIVVNTDTGFPEIIGGADPDDEISIPTIIIGSGLGDSLRAELEDGVEVRLESAVPNSIRPYLGGTCEGGECASPEDFAWLTGEPTTFSNWCDGEPNGDPQGVLQVFNDSFCWNDTVADLAISRASLVEFPMPPADEPFCFRSGPGATQSCYEVVIEPFRITWDAARALAEARTFDGRPGHLATITSPEERAFIAALTRETRRREAEAYTSVGESGPFQRTFESRRALFGANLTNAPPLTGELVIVDDGTGQPSDACEPLTPARALAIDGRIAVVDRGLCTFQDKVERAQAAGAIGVVIVNNVAGNPPVVANTFDPDPMIDIPIFGVTFEAGQHIRSRLDGEGVVPGTLSADSGPDFKHYLGATCPGGACESREDLRWITGERLSYTAWCRGEPNADPSPALEIFNDTFCWNDIDSTALESRSYIVEYPTDLRFRSGFEADEERTGNPF